MIEYMEAAPLVFRESLSNGYGKVEKKPIQILFLIAENHPGAYEKLHCKGTP